MEALVSTSMEVFLKPPKLELLNQLLLFEPNKCYPHEEVLPQLLVQCLLENLVFHLQRVKEEISWPDFSSAAFSFPPRSTTGVRASMLNINKDSNIEENCTTTRFLFDHKAINELKSMSTCYETKPTRYQVLSSFINKHMIVAIKEDKTRPMVAFHVVDMRKRMGEPFLKRAIGNLLWPALVILEGVNKNTEIIDLVEILKE
ncbi:uncharacterized protein LOC106763503 [Vigna radiata var. radiata]|uniref:Uncharacterized protein LOC106763503 n=1 Tax=Vigna radiata var. radiata TaxID=3916 RepID=A0A1S3UAY0_VIGRR|nr:uncharacterized protein LOC106763503 [Vigna radiata var. radiata]